MAQPDEIYSAVIRNGRVIATGAPVDLIESATAVDVEVTGTGLTDPLLTSMTEEGLLASYRLEAGVARVVCMPQKRASLVTELVHRGVLVHEVRTRRGTLEEAFLTLVRPTEVED